MTDTIIIRDGIFYKFTYIDKNGSLKKVSLMAKNDDEAIECARKIWNKYPVWYVKVSLDKRNLFEQKRLPNFSKENTVKIIVIMKLYKLIRDVESELNVLEKSFIKFLPSFGDYKKLSNGYNVNNSLQLYTQEYSKIAALQNIINKKKLLLSPIELEIVENQGQGLEGQVVLAEKVWNSYDKIDQSEAEKSVYDTISMLQQGDYTCDKIQELFA